MQIKERTVGWDQMSDTQKTMVEIADDSTLLYECREYADCLPSLRPHVGEHVTAVGYGDRTVDWELLSEMLSEESSGGHSMTDIDTLFGHYPWLSDHSDSFDLPDGRDVSFFDDHGDCRMIIDGPDDYRGHKADWHELSLSEQLCVLSQIEALRPPQVEPSPLAIRRAWQLARRHKHHWAKVSATPDVLAFGRCHRDIAPYSGKPLEEEYPDLYDSYLQVQSASGVVPVAPTTREEAMALSALPDGYPDGIIEYTCDAAGYHSHTTGTGRTEWEVSPAGDVRIWIHRPSGTVISCDIYHDAYIARVHTDECIGTRHLEALQTCLSALCVTEMRIIRS